jgi:hypothetical protein
MNKQLQEELLAMKQKDMDYRDSLLKNGSLYEGYDDRMEAIHLENAERLNEIIQSNGWPGKFLVGKEGATAAFMIAQHTISSPMLQRSFLKSLSKAVVDGEATKIQEACLQDRILFNEGKPQQYGMLFDWNDNGELFTVVDDIEKANKRRKELGLKTVEEATEAHRKEVVEEGGGPPKDIKKHRQMALEWAIKVGWKTQAS